MNKIIKGKEDFCIINDDKLIISKTPEKEGESLSVISPEGLPLSLRNLIRGINMG